MAEERVMYEEEDRISKLPDSLILHILSFVSTEDAVSTCLISKSWRLMWYCVPKLSFSDSNLANDPIKFYNYVDNYLEHRKKGMNFIGDSAITSFKLHMDYSYERSKVSHLDRWLAFIAEKKVKEIDLHVNKTKINYYSLPKTLAVNSSYLTILKLTSVELDSSYSFSFPSLKTLSLAFVRLGDNVVEKILMGSSSLERLQLHFCYLSSDPQLRINIQHSLSLKFLDIILHKDLVEQIELINLESLFLTGVSFEKIKVSACKAIRILELTSFSGMVELSPLEHLISNLPLLEEFTFTKRHKCKLKHIKISNQHLEKLFVHNAFDEELNVTLKSTLKLTTVVYLSINVYMTLIHYIPLILYMKALLFPEKLKRVCRSPLVDWKNLTFFTKCEPETESNLKDALQWISPTFDSFENLKDV
ncbi:putative F-box/FBD/LRR-repeat protein At1g78760 [Cannabis sativa]|uniref:putative F-box/FBD/LRR-repeat protein At1g78760 n=1 Tax=Cannabis sativa TaxID=3483 RepID=UPI0029CA2EDD|nr:putative F-box/FBD/LRR-repeat protein At1g78760 [Cannabis sativa]